MEAAELIKSKTGMVSRLMHSCSYLTLKMILQDGVLLAMDGVLKVYYLPPNSPHNKNPTGFMKVTLTLTVATVPSVLFNDLLQVIFLASVAEKFKDVNLESFEGMMWMDAQQWASLTSDDVAESSVQRVIALAHSTPPDQVAPVGIIAMELESLQVL